MKTRTLVILALVAVGLGAFIWFVERDLPSTEERAKAEKKVLQGLETKDVVGVSVETGEQKVSLVRQGEADAPTWRIEAPLEARADRNVVEGLVQRLIDLESRRRLDGAARADFGLATPVRRFVLTTAAGAEVALEVGDAAPVGEGVVVARGGSDDLFLVDAAIAADLDKPAGDWRDRQLVPVLRTEVASLRLGSQGVLLAERGDQFWVEAPVVDRADEDHVNALFATLSSARAERFVDEPTVLAELGLDPPQAELEVVVEGQETPIRIAWGSATGPEGGRFWASVDGQVVETTADLATHLARTPAEWRSRAWTATRSFDVERVDLGSGGPDVTVTRAENGSDWLRGTEQIGYAAVSDLLYAITSARAVEVADPGAVSVGETSAVALTLTNKEGDRVEGLRLHQVGDQWWGPAPGREALLRFDAAWVAELQAKIAAVRDAEVVEGDAPAGEGGEGAGE